MKTIKKKHCSLGNNTSYSTNQQGNFGYDYLLRLLGMSVFIHFQHFMEDMTALPIEL
jgi:hypothetical protein